MYLGLPVFAFGIDYNKETTENKAQYFSNSDELITLITSIRKNALSEMGQTMFSIATKRYNWESVARQYAEAID
jgi:glycosyltransferase involved in cell wall biosynthesis